MVTEIEIEEIPKTKEMKFEDFEEQQPCSHTFLFGSEYLSVDGRGNVLVLSIPQLSQQSDLKGGNGDSMLSACKWMHDSQNHKENTLIEIDNAELHPKSLQVTSSKPEEMDLFCEDYKIACDGISVLDDEPNHYDFKELDLSPRLTNFIKSGIVPESPLSNGKWIGANLMILDHVSFPMLQAGISLNSMQHDDKTIQIGALSMTNAPYLVRDDNKIPEQRLNKNAPSACISPIQVAKSINSRLAEDPTSSSSEGWVVDSGGKSEMVERQCKFKRLRKRKALYSEVPQESKKLNGLKRKQDISVYIHEEAEVSSELIVSDDEDDEQNSSYEDSFIDDGVSTTLTDTQPGFSSIEMIGVYRRSLLSQSPVQILSNFSTSPHSGLQSHKMNACGTSSGKKHDKTPQTGLESTAKTCQLTCQMISTEVNNECRQITQIRKWSFQDQSLPMVNLDKEFSVLSEAANGSSFQLQVNRLEEKLDAFEDDKFYEDVDLDAVEEEAAKLLKYKPEYSTTRKSDMANDSLTQNLGILGLPSFDLGF